MPISEAQKRAIKKYQQQHPEKMKEYSKLYYQNKKKKMRDLEQQSNCLQDRVEELEQMLKKKTKFSSESLLKKKIEKQKLRINRLEEVCMLNDIDPTIHPNDYEDKEGVYHMYDPDTKVFHQVENY